MESKHKFEKERYLRVEEFIEDPLLFVAYRYALLRACTMFGAVKDHRVPTSHAFYGDPLMDTILEISMHTLEQLTGLELLPTYSYYRVYRSGSVLVPHKDRPACEVSMTLCLGKEGDHDWPIFVQRDDQEEGVPVSLEPGDCLVYRGCEVKHWREKFDGELQAQVFMHYVDRNGPHSDQHLDGRASLGLPKWSEGTGDHGLDGVADGLGEGS